MSEVPLYSRDLVSFRPPAPRPALAFRHGESLPLGVNHLMDPEALRCRANLAPKAVKARLWPWLLGQSAQNLLGFFFRPAVELETVKSSLILGFGPLLTQRTEKRKRGASEKVTHVRPASSAVSVLGLSGLITSERYRAHNL